jgi:hypothetical protein
MSTDVVDLTEDAYILISTALLIVAGYRAVEVSRVLVGRVYRYRAYWTLGLILAFLFFVAASNFPNIPVVSWGGGTLGFLVATYALFLFVDSNIRMAKELDFFHREILRWQAFRLPIVGALTITGALSILALALFPPGDLPIWAGVSIVSYFAVLGVVLVYSSAALIVGSRRTPDAAMKKFVRMLSFTLVCLALYFTIWLPLSYFGTDVENFGSDFFVIPAAYFIYRAVMSLSPLGHVEKEVSATPTPGESNVPTNFDRDPANGTILRGFVRRLAWL